MKTFLQIVFLFFIILSFEVSAKKYHKKEDSKWWVKTYKLSDHLLVSDAHQIFNKVLQASDKRSNLLPKLFIVRNYPKILANVINDGSIIITEKALKLCYENIDRKSGDTRLAFIFAHELAHLANGDLLFDESGNKKTIAKEKEEKADKFALIYIWIAGFNPKLIIAEENIDFFKHWNKEDNYFLNRITPLKIIVEDICNNLNLFDLGIKLYQVGKYKDSKAFLEKFNKDYSSREVLNNIGLVYYQMAVNELAKFDINKAFQYKLSIILDTETRAKKFVLRGNKNDHFRKFNEYITKAKDMFEEACAKDNLYVYSHLNLLSPAT